MPVLCFRFICLMQVAFPEPKPLNIFQEGPLRERDPPVSHCWRHLFFLLVDKGALWIKSCQCSTCPRLPHFVFSQCTLALCYLGAWEAPQKEQGQGQRSSDPTGNLWPFLASIK